MILPFIQTGLAFEFIRRSATQPWKGATEIIQMGKIQLGLTVKGFRRGRGGRG
jgi:hypothetical protein